jgi:hypothetical protein
VGEIVRGEFILGSPSVSFTGGVLENENWKKKVLFRTSMEREGN